MDWQRQLLENRSRAASYKRTTRLAMLQELLDRTKGRCFWCGRGIVANKLLRYHHVDIIWSDEENIVYREQWATANKLALLMTVDHIFPFSRGGSDFATNLVPACVRCNKTRTDVNRRQEFDERSWQVEGWLPPDPNIIKIDQEIIERLRRSSKKKAGILSGFESVKNYENDALSKLQSLEQQVLDEFEEDLELDAYYEPLDDMLGD